MLNAKSLVYTMNRFWVAVMRQMIKIRCVIYHIIKLIIEYVCIFRLRYSIC